MERQRTLVVYYSRTGGTRRLARLLSGALGADLEELRDRVDRAGIAGWLRSGTEAALGTSAEIRRPRRDAGDYDVVVVGAPVWAASLAPPVRTYLWLERERLPVVAFFQTLGGMGGARAFAQMRATAGKAPVATLSVREGDLARDDDALAARVAEFADAVRRGARRRKVRAAS